MKNVVLSILGGGCGAGRKGRVGHMNLAGWARSMEAFQQGGGGGATETDHRERGILYPPPCLS